MSASNSPLTPTYIGIVNNTTEALVLFEACLSGTLNHVPRRPHDRERKSLIQSGYIFIYEEHASGIKRWTDGINWSPSRILGNFLVYRELNGNVHPGEKKRALKNKASPTKRPSSNGGIVKHSHSNSHSSLNSQALSHGSAFSANQWGSLGSEGSDAPMDPNQEADDKDPMRHLVGSLTDSYDFKDPDGLVKKTISVKIRGVTHHLVNYYNVDHAITGGLRSPWEDPRFRGQFIRPELYDQPGFRVPIGPDCFDQEGNGYVSNIVGSGPVDGRIHTNMVIPVQRQHHGSIQFDGFVQGNPTPNMHPHMNQFGDTLQQLENPQFQTQLGGGFGMGVPAPYAPQTPTSYHPHPSFEGQLDGHFGASPPNGNGFKMEPQDSHEPFPGHADHGFGNSHQITNGENGYHFDGFGGEFAGSGA